MKKNTKTKALSTAKKAIVKTTKTAVENPITTVYLMGGLVALYGIYKVYKAFNPTINDTVKNVGNGSTIKATITKQQATNFAKQLLDAMNLNRNSFVAGGTYTDTIDAVFDKLKNGDDFTLVFKAFGNKDYNGYNSPIQGWEWAQTYEPRNLVYWLKSELSSNWLFGNPKTYNKVKARVESAGFAF